MNEELNSDTTVFDEEYERQEVERTLQQAEERRQAEESEETATATPQPAQQQEKKPEQTAKPEMEDADLGGFLTDKVVDLALTSN